MILPRYQAHDGDGPHLLLVHGFLSSESQWLLNLEALQTFCKPVTVELFGHHRSPSPDDPACFDPGYYVNTFDAIREQLGCSRWFLLGYSLGAGLTLRYAIEHPDRVIGHLFTNSTSGLADSERQAAFRASAPEVADRIRRGGLAAIERIPVHPKHGRKLPRLVHQALVEDARSHDPDGIANTLARTNPEVSMLARLAENRRPACLIQGVKENRFQPLAEQARARMPLLETVPLQAGHGVNMEAAAAFNAAVQDFVRTCPTS